MTSLNTVEGIQAEIDRCRFGSGPSEYLPLLRRCRDVRRSVLPGNEPKADPSLAAEIDDYCDTLASHGYGDLGRRLRSALPLDEMPELVTPAPQPVL